MYPAIPPHPWSCMAGEPEIQESRYKVQENHHEKNLLSNPSMPVYHPWKPDD